MCAYHRAPGASCPATIALSSGIVCRHVVVTCLSECRVQPPKLLVDLGPRIVVGHGREEKNCSAEPRQLHSHDVNGFRIRCNGRLAMILDQVDAATGNSLKCGLAVGRGWRRPMQRYWFGGLAMDLRRDPFHLAKVPRLEPAILLSSVLVDELRSVHEVIVDASDTGDRLGHHCDCLPLLFGID